MNESNIYNFEQDSSNLSYGAHNSAASQVFSDLHQDYTQEPSSLFNNDETIEVVDCSNSSENGTTSQIFSEMNQDFSQEPSSIFNNTIQIENTDETIDRLELELSTYMDAAGHYESLYEQARLKIEELETIILALSLS